MPRFQVRKLVVPTLGALALAGTLVATQAAAQPATGTITGRVVWGSCVRGVPLPLTPNDQAQPVPPEDPSLVQPNGPIRRPVPTPFGLPAGAVLVAAQNTAISARTDESGKFTLSGVPSGQYLTVAAGPVADANVAVAARPNVLVNGSQSVDIGTLSLGGASPLGVACRFPLDVPTSDVPNATEPAMPGEAPPAP